MWLLKQPRRSIKAFCGLVALAILSFSVKARAAEVQLMLGVQSYSSLSGCCNSEPTREGYGMTIQVKPNPHDIYEVFGYTDRRWSEIQLMKSYFLVGGDDGLDPSSTDSMTIRRVKNWKVLLLPGLGFFIHNSRTKTYDLPVVVSGFTLGFYLRTEYAWNDNVSITLGVRAAGSYATDDQGFLVTPLLGTLIRF